MTENSLPDGSCPVINSIGDQTPGNVGPAADANLGAAEADHEDEGGEDVDPEVDDDNQGEDVDGGITSLSIGAATDVNTSNPNCSSYQPAKLKQYVH